MTTIITPRPPLNLFEVVRIPVGDTWTTVYDVPDYLIPADGPNPEQTINTAAIVSNLLVTNLTAGAITADIRVLDPSATPFMITAGEAVDPDSYAAVNLDKHILMTGEQIQVKLSAGATGIAHLSFVLNQREQFTVL